MKILFSLLFCSMISFGTAHSECGQKTNYVLQMYNPGNITQVEINNLQTAELCPGGNYVGGPGVYTPSPVNVQNFQANSFPNCASSPNTCQVAADITASGVSTTNTIGGLDTGTVASNTDYCLWLVSDGTGNLSGIGLVWSTMCGNAGPRPPVSVNYPYFTYMTWNHTNNSCPGPGCGFIFGTITIGTWINFVQDTRRCTGIVSCLPLVAAGTAPKWTPLWLTNFLSPGGDTVTFSILNYAGGHVAVAPNVQFNNAGSLLSNGLCDNNTAGLVLLCAPFSSDRGLLAYWSTSSSGFVYLSGFHDGQL